MGIFDTFQEHYVNYEKDFHLVEFEVSTKLVALVELEKRGISGLPKPLQIELVTMCKPLKDRNDCYQTFLDNFVAVKTPLDLVEYEVSGTLDVTITATVQVDGKRKTLTGKGNGPIDAYLQALNTLYENDLTIHSYGANVADQEATAHAGALCYISCSFKDQVAKFGVGMKPNTTHASLVAVTSAANRALSVNGSSESSDTFDSLCSISATIQHNGEKKAILGSGNGPVAAFISGLRTYYDEAKELKLLDYTQSARGVSKAGHNSEAVCAIACSLGENKKRYGMGLDVNTNTASAKAILSALTLLSN